MKSKNYPRNLKYFNCFVKSPLGSIGEGRRISGPQEGAHIFLFCGQQFAEVEWRTPFNSIWYRNEKNQIYFNKQVGYR